MHRYFKKLRNELSSPSSFTSENSPLNQETREQNTQTQAPNPTPLDLISGFASAI